MKQITHRLTLSALLISIAFILSFLESQFPFPLPVAGLKLGLANVITLFAVYMLTLHEGIAIVLVRCLLSSLLFGGLSQFAFSLTGGLLALFAMTLLAKIPSVSPFGVGIGGSAAHHIGQVTVAVLLMQMPQLYAYLIALLPASILTGVAVALVYVFFSQRFSKIFSFRPR